MMDIVQAATEKVSYWLEWRKMGTAYYATMQVLEPDNVKSHNPATVKRYRLTKQEANLPLLDLMRKYPRVFVPPVDYTRRVSLPIRDALNDGQKINVLVTIYGLTKADISVIPHGAEPFKHAIRRMGLDPARFQVFIWDIEACESHNYEPPDKPRK